jgi:KaiC/GvpD/RAD55 family RecA-like ATPase
MNLQTFLKTLKNYGYNSQHTAHVLTTLLKTYTEHTYSRKILPSRDTGLFVAFRILSNKGNYFTFTSEGLHIAEELIAQRTRNVSEEIKTPDTFFILKFMHPHINDPEIQFLLSSGLNDRYERTLKFLEKGGLAYADENTLRAPRNLHTFFDFPFEEEPFDTILREIRAYMRLSSFNRRIMKVTFSDMQDCKQEVMTYIKDMRKQGIIKEFMREKGYSFRVLDAQKYKTYTQNLLNKALQKLRFVPPDAEYTVPVHCGWDSVGLLDEYPVPAGTPMNILLFGDPGPLKQLWSQHYTYGELLGGNNGIYVSINSPPEDIRKNFLRFQKDIRTFEEESRFRFVDCYPRRQKSQERFAAPINTSLLTDFGMAISDAYQEMESEGGVVVFDSLSNLMLYFNPEQVIKFAVDQASRLKEWEWTGIFITEKGVNDEKIENSLKFLLDGVFEIRNSEFHISWIRGVVDKPAAYALDISKRGLLLLPKR